MGLRALQGDRTAPGSPSSAALGGGPKQPLPALLEPSVFLIDAAVNLRDAPNFTDASTEPQSLTRGEALPTLAFCAASGPTSKPQAQRARGTARPGGGGWGVGGLVLQRPRPQARPTAAAPTSFGRTGAAADAHGREDPEEVVEAGSPVLQGAGRAGPPRVPGSGEPGEPGARAGGPGRQRGPRGPLERSRGAGAAGTIAGRGGRRNDRGARGARGAAGRSEALGACRGRERGRPSAEPWQPRGWVCGRWFPKSRAGAGAGLCSSGCTAWLSRGLPPSACPPNHSWPRPSGGRRSRASVPAPIGT